MKKICTISGKEFEVMPEDQAFYKKMGVPEPTLCPDERLRRRFAFRNERYMHHINCDATGKKIVSYHSPDKIFPVYENTYWWGDSWDATKYGRDFDFNRPFFEQFQELKSLVPKMAMLTSHSENCDWSPYSTYAKNCYLSISAFGSEDTHYSFQVNESDKCMDCSLSRELEYCYESINCTNSHKLLYSYLSSGSSNSWFLKNCSNCRDCIACVNLVNKQYCILNTQYSKQQYLEKLEELNLGSRKNIKYLQTHFRELCLKHPNKYMFGESNENCSGDNIHNSTNSQYCYDVNGIEDSKYVMFIPLDLQTSYDVNFTPKSELVYDAMSMVASYNCAFGAHSWDLIDSYYCEESFYSNNLFGCSGIKNSAYIILNKQYSKDEYLKLRGKIIEYMKQTGEWGEFFPISLSSFGYNQTVANEYFPLSEDEAKKLGYNWEKQGDSVEYVGAVYDIPDNITEVSEDILKEILRCSSCNKNYRIIAPELEFYKKLGIPIPTACPNCRHSARMKIRNPRQLHRRGCDKCNTEIQTTYPPDAPDIVYCGECYDAEIY